jgi:riboflavin-specific deaminase-like protein
MLIDLEALYAPLDAVAWTLGHLGQSVDGRIATESGHSHYVNGPANIDHLHRLRALADAVVVGAGTVASDDPRLTVRRVQGDNPVRVVLDPRRGLGPHHAVFEDDGTPTLLITATGEPGRHGAAEVVVVDRHAPSLAPMDVLACLAERGLARVFVEGGGVTVSRFLDAGVLDRLHVCVAPLLIGSGRPALTLPPVDTLATALRPPCRVAAMGDDVLFDFDLSS